MTRQELSDLLGYKGPVMVNNAFREAAKEMPSIKEKDTDNKHVQASFTKEEILFVCKFLPLNPIQVELVRDNYIAHDRVFVGKEKSPYINGTEKFLHRLKGDPKFRCCANCIYIKGKNRTSRETKLLPFCSFYNRYISRIKIEFKNYTRNANIFKDKCQSYRRGPVKFFFKSGYQEE